MSFLLRNTQRFVGVARPAILSRGVGVVQQRGFRTSGVMMLKESDRNNPDLGEQNHKHIQDGLEKQKQGKGHWKPELASDSEEAVAADRHEHNDHSEEGIKELQHKTKEHAQKKHEHGTSQDPGV